MSNGKLANPSAPSSSIRKNATWLVIQTGGLTKRRWFGGDDGIEFIEAERLVPMFDRNHRCTHLNVHLSETEVLLSLITR